MKGFRSIKSEFGNNTKYIVIYSLYAILFDLGLSPSNKGTIYLKELIEYIIFNHLYDHAYKEILEQFAEENNYDLRKLQSNIKNAIYRLDTSKAEKNFEKYFSIEFDTYYLSPNKFVSLIVLILRS